MNRIQKRGFVVVRLKLAVLTGKLLPLKNYGPYNTLEAFKFFEEKLKNR